MRTLKFGEIANTTFAYKNSAAMHGYVTCCVCESYADHYHNGYYFVQHYGNNVEKVYMSHKGNDVYCSYCVGTFDNVHENAMIAMY